MAAVTRTLTLPQTTIGQKAIMAVSGLAMFGFVIGHMIGNLKLYQGPEKLNEYAAFLRTVPALLWGARAVLLVAVGAHIWSSIQLGSRNAEARPVGYRRKKSLASTYASRTMYWTGPILLFYIVYHVLHLTFGYGIPGNAYDPHNVYNNVVLSFQQPLIAGIYVLGNLALGFHLFHGATSMFQTIGASHPRYDRTRNLAALGLVGAVLVGNLSFPLMVLAGVVQPTDQTFFFPALAH
ncbi:MAG TPA: succinate dehydrogenase cytochrome b subunit [Polyangiaceae bacterium LLY-WYZ-14_1]|jgi:succinate dehydrogenase / fumarate reductase cytochrome b subunit|nr:succinate dehydrogenase cytochrome b subunit [Polyangiaceae bacterium LLY-WYZ-14_1]